MLVWNDEVTEDDFHVPWSRDPEAFGGPLEDEGADEPLPILTCPRCRGSARDPELPPSMGHCVACGGAGIVSDAQEASEEGQAFADQVLWDLHHPDPDDYA